MGIEPHMERWRRRFACCLLFAAGILLLTGAKEITHGLHGRPARIRQVRERLCQWSLSLTGEVPSERRSGWSDLAELHPELMLRACSQTASAESTRSAPR